MKDIVDYLNIGPGGVHVGIITYSSEAFLDIPLGSINDKESLNTAIDALPWRNRLTNTSGAIRLMRETMFNGKGECPPLS